MIEWVKRKPIRAGIYLWKRTRFSQKVFKAKVEQQAEDLFFVQIFETPLCGALDAFPNRYFWSKEPIDESR